MCGRIRRELQPTRDRCGIARLVGGEATSSGANKEKKSANETVSAVAVAMGMGLERNDGRQQEHHQLRQYQEREPQHKPKGQPMQHRHHSPWHPDFEVRETGGSNLHVITTTRETVIKFVVVIKQSPVQPVFVQIRWYREGSTGDGAAAGSPVLAAMAVGM